jgi:transposase
MGTGAVSGVYKAEQGQPPYHPGMMVALLLYGYSRGIYSSRQLALSTYQFLEHPKVVG